MKSNGFRTMPAGAADHCRVVRLLAGASLALLTACGSSDLRGRIMTGGDPVLADGAVIERVLDGFGATSAPLWMPRGHLLFTDLATDTIHLWNPPQKPIVFRRSAGWPVSHERDAAGRIVSAQLDRRVTWTEVGGRVSTLADAFGGEKLNGPVDVALGPEGAVYFVDARSIAPWVANAAGASEGRRPTPRAEQTGAGIYRVGDDGRPRLVSRRPAAVNGIAFSPDRRWLYATDAVEGGVFRCAVRRDGTLGPAEPLVTMRAGPNETRATGAIAVHPATGMLFVCGPGGLWMIAAEGRVAGRLAFDEPATGVAFGGPAGRTLFITAGGSVYRIELRRAINRRRALP